MKQMKKNHFQNRIALVLSLPLFLGLTECHKRYDEPPPYTGPAITANASIRHLKNQHVPGSFEQVLDDSIIEGIVVANDIEDNFYKSVVIQDSTGGITIRLDGFSLYNVYPVGRKLFIRLRGLWMGDYGGQVQLGAGVDRSDSLSPQLTAVPQPLFDRFIVNGSLNNSPAPKLVGFDELNDSLQSCLITIKNAEFVQSDTGKPYADAANRQSVSHTIRSCGVGSIYIRTSGFAKFAAARTPKGNGSITGIYTVYKTQKQLLIRDTAEVRMNGLRCSVTGPKLLFSEDFESTQTGSDVMPSGWKNITEAGDKKFLSKQSNGNWYAEVSAFASRQPAVISWLIMPPVNLNHSADEILRFVTKDGFDNGAVLQVMVSSNYDGGAQPWKARWTVLPAVISKGSVSGFAGNWLHSGNVKLDHLSGAVYIAFRYEGNDPATTLGKLTTTFRLDDIKIMGN